MNRSFAALATLIASSVVSMACLAGEVRYYAEDQIATPADIATLLAPPASAQLAADASQAHGGRTRGVRMLDRLTNPHRVDRIESSWPESRPTARRAEPATPVRVAQADLISTGKIASTGAVALALRFGVDDAQVLPHQMAQLDALAAGILSLPQGALITVAGHTDAQGSAAYNIDLSLKRAMAVRAYLIQVHGIPGKRLVAVGKGRSEPLNRANPFAPENRRVQVSAEYDLA
jgi:OmpA-OmpF porin, OOP family